MKISFSWYWVEQWQNNRKWHVHFCNNECIDEQLKWDEHEHIDDFWSNDDLVFKNLQTDSSDSAFWWLIHCSDIKVSVQSAWEVIKEAKDWIA